MKTYELVRHRPSGEVYALQLERHHVRAVCGPLHHSEQNAPLPDYEYEAEDAEWAERQDWQPIRSMGLLPGQLLGGRDAS